MDKSKIMQIDLKAIRAAAERIQTVDGFAEPEKFDCLFHQYGIETRPEVMFELLDRLEAAESQLAIYEKHGVTCQTFGHKLTGCAECNRDDFAAMKDEQK